MTNFFRNQFLIRALDTRKDLLQAADLIEICFGEHLDPDGHLYLSQIRKAARNHHLVRWSYAAGELISYPLNGFVCEYEEQVIGNLSLIPFYWQRQWRYLIANVAVHPDFRRQGIAKWLTNRALDHVKKRPIDSVWLHVREDNDAAVRLYEQLNFIPRFRRDTWVSQRSYSVQAEKQDGISIVKARSADWKEGKKWLEQYYPPGIVWHQGLNIERYRPGFWNKLWLLLEGKHNAHWSIFTGNHLAGTAVLEKSFSYADQLFLAPRRGQEEQVIPILLPDIKQKYAPDRQISINFPAGLARDAFRSAAFDLLNTLIWMEIRLN